MTHLFKPFSSYVIRGTLQQPQHFSVIRGLLPGVSMPKPNRNLESVILGNVSKHTRRLCITHCIVFGKYCMFVGVIWSRQFSDIPVVGVHSQAPWPIHSPTVIISGSNLFLQPHSGAIQSLRPVMQSTGFNRSISVFIGAPVHAG